MTGSQEIVPSGDVVDRLTLTQLCRLCGSHAEWIVELVEEGILEPEGATRSAWRFETASVTIVRKVNRLQSDLRVNVPGAAVVLTLAAENARLKRRIAQLERDLSGPIPMPDD
ncbi:MAG: chaperone modulator CbpM [Litorimonas sp.]